MDMTSRFQAAVSPQDVKREPFLKGGLRTAAQGLTFGFGDEIEAGIRSALQGVPYEQSVADIRASQQRYQEQNPWKSMGLQIAGSLPLALTGIGAGAGLRGMMALGAASGAVTQIGSNEGSIMDRASNLNVPVAAGLGAIAGPAVKAATVAVGGAFNKAVDVARRYIGNRGSQVFENYIADLVKRTGKTVDELVAEIGSGKMLVDNETVTAIARGALVQDAEAGASRAILTEAMKGRPEQFRRTAESRFLRDLTGRTTGESPAEIQTQLTRQAEEYKSQAYAPFKTQEVGGAVEQQLLRDISGAPSIVDELDTAYKIETRGRSLFVRDEDTGKIIGFDRNLTADDLERVRRAADNMTKREFEARRGLVGDAAAGLEEDLRNTVDTLFPDMTDVRAEARRLYRAGLANLPPKDNAFAAGRQAVSNADQAELYWNSIVGDPMIEDAYRRGVMDNLRGRLASRTANTTLSDILKDNTNLGRVFRMIYPSDQLDEAIKAADLAVTAQTTRTGLLSGTTTAGNISESARANAGINPMDAFEAASGSVPAMLRTVNQIIGKTENGLSAAERERLAKALIETNPDLVRKALTDDSVLRTLQNAISIYTQRFAGAAGVGGAEAAAIMVPNEPLRMTITNPANQ